MLKLISIKLDNIPPRAEEAEAAERDEKRPPFLIPFDRKFKLDEIPEIIGRDGEVEHTLSILASESNGNVMYLGFPGTGKTAIAQVIAKLFADGKLDPTFISGSSRARIEVCYLDANILKAGGQATKKLAALEAYLEEFPDTIVFVDESHLLGKTEVMDSSPIFELMKPMLNRRNSHFIFATTDEEHRLYLEPIPAAGRRYTIVPIAETDLPTTKVILRRHRQTLLDSEKYRALPYAVVVADGIVNLVAEMSTRFLDPKRSGYNPSRSIKLLEQALARLTTKNAMLETRLNGICRNLLTMYNEYIGAIAQRDERSVEDCRNFLLTEIAKYLESRKMAEITRVGELSAEHVYEALSILTGLSHETFEKLDKKFLETLGDELKKEIIGQDRVIEELARRIRRARLGLGDPRRPIFAGIFAGPTGVGKTQTAKVLAKTLFGREDAVVEINGPEYNEAYKLAKLTGSPAGYVGYGDKAKLDEIKDKGGRCVVLIDEFEKMTKEAQNILLRILDEGEVENARGERINFKEAVIIFTSNLGSEKLIVLPAEDTSRDWEELIAFRKDTVQAIERLAEKLEAESSSLQSETRFEEARSLSEKAIVIRDFLARHTDDLQKGIFTDKKTGVGELDALIALRSAEDRGLVEGIRKGGEAKYEALLSSHRKKAKEEILAAVAKRKAMLEALLKSQEKDEEKRARCEAGLKDIQEWMDMQNIEMGLYLAVCLQNDKELSGIITAAEDKERELAGKLSGSKEADASRQTIEEANQKIIDEVFGATYRPEFLARIRALGGVFAFNPMNREMARGVVRIHARRFTEQMRRLHNCNIEISEEVFDYLLTQAKALAGEGGRGIEKIFDSLIKDPMAAEFSRAGHRDNTKVVVSMSGSNVNIRVISLGKPDVTKLPEQQGEAGTMLEHFHRQAVDITRMFSNYRVTREQILALLRGEQIVDAGTPLQFEPAEMVVSSSLLECLGSFRGNPIGQGLKYLAHHLRDEGLDPIIAEAVPEIAKGLALMAAKTLFNYILANDFGNSQDNYDRLKDKSRNGSSLQLIDDVKAAGAAKNSRIAWSLTSQKIDLEVTIPAKLTEREVKMMQIYLTRAVDNPEAAQKIFEEAKAQGLILNLSLLRNLAVLKSLLGSEMKIGFCIEEGEVHFWFTSPILAVRSEEKLPAAAPNAEDLETSLPAFEEKKGREVAYLRSYMKASLPVWGKIANSGKPITSPKFSKFYQSLILFLAEQKDEAQESGSDPREYLEDAIKELSKEIDSSQKENFFSLASAVLLSINENLSEKYSNLSSQMRDERILKAIAGQVKPLEKAREETLTSIRALLSGRNDIPKSSGLLTQMASNAFFCRLLAETNAEVELEKGEGGKLTAKVTIGRYATAFTFRTGKGENDELQAKLQELINKLDVLPKASSLTSEVLAEINKAVEELNDSPLQIDILARLMEYPALEDGWLYFFQQALRGLLATGSKTDPAKTSKKQNLDFEQTLESIRGLLARIKLSAYSPEGERPYSVREIQDLLSNVSASGDIFLSGYLREFLNSEENGISGDAAKAYLEKVLTFAPFKKLRFAAEFQLKKILEHKYDKHKKDEPILFFIKYILRRSAFDNNFLNNILEKSIADKGFDREIFGPMLPEFRKANKLYAGDFNKSLAAVQALVNFAKQLTKKTGYDMELMEWIFEEIENLIKLVDGPDQAKNVTQLLKKLEGTWLAKDYADGLIALSALLSRKLSLQVEKLSSQEFFDPMIQALDRSPNTFEIYREGNIPDAIDTVAFLKKNRSVLTWLNNLLVEALRGRFNVFRCLNNNQDTIKSVLENGEYFSRAGGSVILLAIREKRGKKYVYLSVTGRTGSGIWEFEAEITV